MDEDATWCRGRPQPTELYVRWGPSLPSPKRGYTPSPIFGLFLLRPNGWIHQDATWYGGRPHPRGSVFDGNPAPPPKRGWRSPQFSANVYCGQTAAWTKMPLGTKVGLSPGDFVLDVNPVPSPKRAEPPIFGPRLLWPSGCMDQDAAWQGGRCRPTRHCVRWGPSSPPLKGHSSQFSAIVRCGQTAGWTKMPLGMEVGLVPGDFVFDCDPATPRKKGTPTPPNFWPMSILAKRLDG